ncbi:hypothetical protein [Pseudoalteromonas ruthenica]|uniref:hypothetical protein n=1 Tax=Pseudoalteromonas ruthenica TaxID=151081 RepID=UPI00110A3ABE|nr:hypothetical protein [Pseudoalteromonas ruthenica]TMP20844.1 hypothetical protein CWC06_19485 [Pseudoalteromonas ruthenica]
MSYRDLSKFKINKLVAQALGMNTNKDDLPAHTLSHDYNERYPDTVWAHKPNDAWEQCCFTNDPAEWGELVRDFCIHLKFDTAQVHAQSYFAECKTASRPHKDIGLAVCIAFLEMKDWQKENGVSDVLDLAHEVDRNFEAEYLKHHFVLDRNPNAGFGNWYMVVKDETGFTVCDGWIDDSSHLTIKGAFESACASAELKLPDAFPDLNS